MSALTSLLARDQVVSVKRIEEAIQRQVISGGELDTILLELDAVPENVISAYCAALHGLIPATRSEVMEASAESIRLVPSEVAKKHRLVPLMLDGRKLVAAVRQPLSVDVDQKLSFLLGVDIEMRIATEARIAAGLHQHYGIEPTPRMRRLTRRLNDRGAGSIPFVAPDDHNEPEFTEANNQAVVRSVTSRSGADVRYPTEGATDQFVKPPETAHDKTVGVTRVVGVGSRNRVRRVSFTERPPSQMDRGRPSGAPPQPRPSKPGTLDSETPKIGIAEARLRGPLTAKRAVEILDGCETRDEIVELFFTFARQFFDYSALFVVHGEALEGLSAHGEGAASEAVQLVSVQLIPSSSLHEVKTSGKALVSSLRGKDDERRLVRELDRNKEQPAALVPVPIRSRVVLLLYGDRSNERFALSDLPELMALVPHTSRALERLILKQKRSGSAFPDDKKKHKSLRAEETPQPSPDALSDDVAPSDRAPQTLATSQNTATHKDTATSKDTATPQDREPQDRPEKDDPGPRKAPSRPRVFDALGVPRSAPPPPAPTLPSQNDQPSEDAASEPSNQERDTDAAFADAGRYSIRSERTDKVLFKKPRPDRIRGRTLRPGPSASSPLQQPANPATNSAPRLPSVPDVVLFGHHDRGADIEPSDASSERPAPTEAPVATKSRPTPWRNERTSETPSVIVTMSSQVEDVVEQLVKCTKTQHGEFERAVLEVGDAALPVLVREFPGPLWVPPRKPKSENINSFPEGREVSAIAHTLVAFRDRAAPYLPSLLDHRKDHIRFYAVLLAREIPHPVLAVPLSRRITDKAADVRAASVHALRLHRRFRDEYSQAMDAVRAIALAPRKDIDARAAAIRALGELRDVDSLRGLIDSLSAKESSISNAALESLVAITRQNFEFSDKKWRDWADRNDSRHRIEWLIDSLTHSDESVRSAASTELKRLTQAYYGYHHSLPKKERETAQRKYRKWWDKEGASRFDRV